MSFPEEVELIKQIVSRFEDPVIVDLGARRGEDTDWVIAACKKQPRAVLVEADIANYKDLVARNLPVDCVYGAIADHDGTCDFWENHDLGWGYGSIYAPMPGANSVNYDMFKRTENVPCFTFDTLFRQQKLEHIDLLWVDLHGAEKDMIRFGREAMSKTHHLFMEALDNKLYEGSATKQELMAMLPGWRLVKEFPWNILLRNEELDGKP